VWFEIALVAGCFQTARNALAKSLAAAISPALNSWSRFAFNLPFATALMLAVELWVGVLPLLSGSFLLLCAVAGISQLLGNVALVSAFRRANYAESIVLHKLEVVFTAVVGIAIFGEVPNGAGWLGILLSGAGVLLINLGRAGSQTGWRRAFHFDAGALLALSCALLLVLASFALKAANASFVAANLWVGDTHFEAAVHTLFHVTWMEVAILSAWLLVREPGELGRVRKHWPRMLAIGFSGFVGSLGWFWAFSLTLVAYVKAVGQVEAVLAVILALVVWREREVWRQLPGVALVVGGIAALLLG
jgi:drug/metabolite transporter (DMT)-like permease